LSAQVAAFGAGAPGRPKVRMPRLGRLKKPFSLLYEAPADNQINLIHRSRKGNPQPGRAGGSFPAAPTLLEFYRSLHIGPLGIDDAEIDRVPVAPGRCNHVIPQSSLLFRPETQECGARALVE